MPLGPPVSDDDEHLGHGGISAPGEAFAQKVLQSQACLCAPSSELTQEEETKGELVIQRGEVGRQPETMAPPLGVPATASWQRLKVTIPPAEMHFLTLKTTTMKKRSELFLVS